MSLKSWHESGLLNREIKLYKELQKNKDIKYTFITYGDEEDLTFSNKLENINIIPLYKDLKYFKNKYIRFLYSFTFPYYLKRLKINPDLIKTNQLNGIWIAIIYKLISRTPLLIRTGYDMFLFKVKERKYIKSLFAYFITQLGIIFSNYYLVSSKSDLRFITEKYFFTKNKILLRPNWVNIPKHTKPFDKRSENTLLSVGRLEEQKNYPQLINAFRNSEFLLDIVGSGTKEKELKSLAKKKNTSCNFLGNIEHNKLLEIYSEYKIFISTTLYEGNPKTILEAMANGCVVVAPNIDNVSEIIDSELNGILFDPSNQNLLKLIKAIIEDNEKMDNISNNSISYVKKYFSFEIAIENEESDYIKSIST
jgi:glycosyltransferase involved in cell wall biosynthesis